MKEFEDLTEDEKKEILKQVQNIPEQPGDSLDMFVRSFDDLSKTWADAIKEFDNIYPNTLKTEDSPSSTTKDHSKWKSNMQRFLR